MSNAVAGPVRNAAAGKSWWREAEVAWLIVLVVAAYFSRADVLPLRGEEPTRAQTAFEMYMGHDWLVPREQGEPFGIRPPVQYWAVAVSCLGLQSWGAWAVRFHSLVATLLTTLLIYGYARNFLSRLGAFAASAAFATLADMFQMGRQAETEALFILLLSASLLVWHWGFMRRWPDALTYALGYGLMALAMLTKGIQAPTYFIASVVGYLVLTRQWRRLFCLGHLWGALVGVAVLLAWVLPYYYAMGSWSAVRSIWLADQAVQNNGSLLNWKFGEAATHLATLPLEVAAGALPWSLLLLAYLRRDFRRSIGEAWPYALFLIVAAVIAFATCWVPPTCLPRYFAPLLPCVAVLIGLVVQRCAEAEPGSPLRAAWRRYVVLGACLMVAAGAAVGAAALLAGNAAVAPWAEPPLVALGYAVLAVGLAVVMFRVREGESPARVRTAVAAFAGFMVVTFTGVVTDVRLHRSENAAEEVERIKELLPPGQPLVSLNGHTDSLFAYLYRWPIITPRPWPADAKAAADLTYFCFVTPGDSRPQLPFAWKEIGVVSLDRNRKAIPEHVVVVGRRLPSDVEGGAASAAKRVDDAGRQAVARGR